MLFHSIENVMWVRVVEGGGEDEVEVKKRIKIFTFGVGRPVYIICIWYWTAGATQAFSCREQEQNRKRKGN